MVKVFGVFSIVAAVAALTTPATAQSQQARDKAIAECRQQQAMLGKGASPTAARDQMQACVQANSARKNIEGSWRRQSTSGLGIGCEKSANGSGSRRRSLPR